MLYSVLLSLNTKKTNWTETDARYGDFYKADFRGAKFQNTNFEGADFYKAKVTSEQAKYLTARGFSGFVVVE